MIGGSSVQCLFFDEMRFRRQKAIDQLLISYDIPKQELDQSLSLGKDALAVYFSSPPEDIVPNLFLFLALTLIEQ